MSVRPLTSLSLFVSKVEGPASDLWEQSGADQREQDKASIQEVVSLHEAGFAVRIQAPATETFELQVHRHRRPLLSMSPGFRASYQFMWHDSFLCFVNTRSFHMNYFGVVSPHCAPLYLTHSRSLSLLLSLSHWHALSYSLSRTITLSLSLSFDLSLSLSLEAVKPKAPPLSLTTKKG